MDISSCKNVVEINCSFGALDGINMYRIEEILNESCNMEANILAEDCDLRFPSEY